MINWYFAKLRSHPVSANIGSALVLMSAGDLMAQHIELRNRRRRRRRSDASKVDSRISNLQRQQSSLLATTTATTTDDKTKPRKMQFRRYGTMSPRLKELRREEHENTSYEVARQVWSEACNEFASLDFFRTGTMAFWAGAVYTPYFLALYKLFDRYLPKQTYTTIMSRCALSFVASIPANAAFFCYGTLIHHVAEWATMTDEYYCQSAEAIDWDEVFRKFPFDLDMLLNSARLKLQTELYSTIVTSATVWIPINMFNFSVVPPHLRPLTLMVCSTFWNCYLSLAQHRDVNL